MTYCVAWKTKNAIFFTADSAIKTTGLLGRPIKEKSSLGELSIVKGNATIEEQANKILKIDNSLLLCYSGNVDLFFEVFNTIKRHFNKSDPFHYVQIALDSVRSNTRINLQLLFATCVENQLRLYSFNLKNDGQIKEHNQDELIAIGIFAQSEIDIKNNSRFQNLLKSDMNPFIVQLYLHFLLQSLSIYEDTMKSGVGGLYNSAFITLDGISYIDDTSILLYNSVPERKTIIPRGICNFFNRYEAFIYNSTISNTKEIFIPYKNNLLYTNAEAQLQLEAYSLNYKPSIVVFYSLNSRIG